MLTDPTLPTAVAPASPQPAPPRPQPQQAAPIPTIRPAANSIPTIRGWQPSPQRQAQEAALQSSLMRQEAPRTPAKGFWGKAGRVLGDIGNVAGTVILGTDKMAAIPGTSEYRAAQHAATGRELTQLETQDQTEQNDEAKRELERAQTQNLENPPNTIEPTAEGIFGINSRNLTATPVSAPGGQPLHPYVKPGPISRVAIQDPNDPTNGIEAIEQDGVIYVPGPNGAYAPVTNPRPFEKPTQQHPTAGLVGGRAAFGLYDPQKGWVDPTTKQPLPGFTPPPNYVEGASQLPNQMAYIPQPGGGYEAQVIQPGMKLPAGSLSMSGASAADEPMVPIIDPNTQRVIGYAARGSIADATGAGGQGMLDAERGGLTPKPGTTVTEQAQNAVSLRKMIQDNIFPSIEVAQKAGIMGPESGRVQEFLRQHVGNPSSPAAILQAQLAAVPMMLGRMYGYRSAQYLQGMQEFLNLRMTPSALRSYLTGVSAHASTIAEQGGMAPKGANNPEPQTGKVFNSAKWLKANPNGDLAAAKRQAAKEGYTVQ